MFLRGENPNQLESQAMVESLVLASKDRKYMHSNETASSREHHGTVCSGKWSGGHVAAAGVTAARSRGLKTLALPCTTVCCETPSMLLNVSESQFLHL